MSACPTTDRLRSLLDGKLAETEQSDLQRHIEDCEACQRTLEGLVAGKESWDGIARQLGDQDTPVTPALQDVMAEAIGPTACDTAVHSVRLPPGFLQPAQQPDSMGRLAHYEILQEVGSGGMGIVLKAFDTSLRRVVAIKVMAPHLAANAAARRRFVREAQAAAAVAHEHVVAIHAVADQHEPPYLAMQFIEGKTLQERLDKSGPLSVREVLRIGMQTASGLAAAHAQGLVHRDIKPANILLENGVERVKLTDFGLARAVDGASVTQSGVIAGTPLFMSPEQARGESIDHRSDLFSLGSVLYAMCVGHAPFRASTTMGVIKRVCDDSPRPIHEVNPDVPDWLSDIIAKLLAKAPADRFQTAAEVADLLGRCLAHLQQPSVVSRLDGVPVAVGHSPSTTADSDDEPASETESSMFRAGLIAFSVGMVPMLAAGQVSAYPELAPPGISPRAFAALLRVIAIACWCLIPAIHWWRESRKPKPTAAGLSSGGAASPAATPPAVASPRQVPFLFSPWSALWLAVFLFLPIAALSLSSAFSPHDVRVTSAVAIFVWLAIVAVGGFLNGLRRRAAAAGVPLADLAPGWRIRCTKCNRSKPLGEVGGIRFGARSYGKRTLAWCLQCRRLRWASIEHVPETSEFRPTVADSPFLEKPTVRRRWWKAAFMAAIVVMCVWRFGPAVVLTARNEGQLDVELRDTDAKLVLRRNGIVVTEHQHGIGKQSSLASNRSGSGARVDAIGGATFSMTPGTYEFEFIPRSGRALDRVVYLHQTIFTSHYEPDWTPRRNELFIGRGDVVKLTAMFKEAAPAPSDKLTLSSTDGRPLDWKAAAARSNDGWILGPDGPKLTDVFGQVVLKLQPAQIEKVNNILRAMYRESRALETGQIQQQTNAAGHLVIRIKPYPELIEKLKDRLWTLLDEILDTNQQSIARLNLKLDPPAIQPPIALTELVRPGFFGWGQHGATLELWRVGTWHHWKMQTRGYESSGNAIQLPDEYRRFWNEPAEHLELVQTLPVGSQVNRLLPAGDVRELIAVGTEDTKNGLVKFWNSATLEEKRTWRSEQPLRTVAIVPGANRLLTVEGESRNGFLVRDAKSFELVTSFANHSVAVTSLAASPDGRWLASGDVGGSVILWQCNLQKNEGTPKALSGHSQEVTTLAFSPDGSLLASGSLDKTVRIFDVASGQLKHMLDRTNDRVTEVRFSDDGQLLAVASWDRLIWILDPVAGNWIGSLRGPTEKANSVALSPDKSLVAAGCFDGSLLVFDRAKGNIVARTDAQQSEVGGVTFLDNDRIASAHRNGFVSVWRLRP